jgi:hypothetical protein
VIFRLDDAIIAKVRLVVFSGDDSKVGAGIKSCISGIIVKKLKKPCFRVYSLPA